MTSPHVKFEHSPADSLVDSFASTPGMQYTSLFDDETMDPSEAIMTPPFESDNAFEKSRSSSVAETPGPETPVSEKKPVKKRKSWGQQLPEPKTNLPPRKRAKTEDEKEQRRVERVLRNRRAAQSSRERKRQEVENLENEKNAIERRNKDLELRLADLEAQNIMLQQQLAQATGNMAVFNQPSPQAKPDPYCRTPTPITLSQELFSSRDSQITSSFEANTAEAHLNLQSSIQTVNPASISPEIRPVSDSSLSNASSSDMTQHPAAVLCDLQCQSEEQRPWMFRASNPSTSAAISALTLCLTLVSAATSTILHPLCQILNSLSTGSSLSPTPSLLSSIIWLTTTPTPLTSTTSSTSPTSPPRKLFSLRLNLLRRLLACSPQLARPLMDATMGVLRSASDSDRVLLEGASCCRGDCVAGARCTTCRSRRRPRSDHEPSVEVLMTLLWATYVIDRENKLQQDQPGAEPSSEQMFSAPPASSDYEESVRLKLEEKSCRRSSWNSLGGERQQRERWEH